MLVSPLFSDHASNFRWIKEHVLSRGRFSRPAGRASREVEWYIGMPPTDRRRQKDVLAEVARIAQTLLDRRPFSRFRALAASCRESEELRPGRPRPLLIPVSTPRRL